MTCPTDVAGFMGCGSHQAIRIAKWDWKSTPLGPIEDWPHTLKQTLSIALDAPSPFVILWGKEGIMLYNDAYAHFAGSRDAILLGQSIFRGWPEMGPFHHSVMEKVFAGESLQFRDHMLTLNRNGSLENCWLHLEYSPIRGKTGLIEGVLVRMEDITQTRHNVRALEQSEARLRFLDQLSVMVADYTDAKDILNTATCQTARHLDAINCCYADLVNPNTLKFTVRGNWHAPGFQSLVGEYDLHNFGEKAVRTLTTGQTLIIHDNRKELPPHEAATFHKIGVVATLGIPLIKDGNLVALFTLHDAKPRRWSEYDISLLREVAERAWAHIQRVSAEDRLREREAYNRQILDSATDYGIVATDLEGKITLWNAGATAMLGWTEKEVLDQSIDMFFTPEDRAAGRPARKRHEALETGRARDARWHLRKSGEQFWGSSEMSPLRACAHVHTHDTASGVPKVHSSPPIGFVKLMRDRTQEFKAKLALRLSEDQLRRAQMAGGIGLFSVDLGDNMVSGTDEFFQIFGLTQSGPIPHSDLSDIIAPDNYDTLVRLINGPDENTPLDIEYRIFRADTGEERYITRKADFERDQNGKLVRMVGAVQDITDKQRALQALEKSEAQFSGLAQHMPTQIWTAKPDGQFDWVNDRTYTYTGLPHGALNGEGWKTIVHPEDLQDTIQRWEASLATGSMFETELRLRDADGQYRWHLGRAIPLADTRGQIASWVITNTEIEAQKQVEAAYAKDRNRLWNISQDLMLVYDTLGMITAVNPSAKRMLGWNEMDMLSKPVTSFIHPDDLEATLAEVAKLRAGASTIAFENRYRTKDGAYCLLAWTAVQGENRIHAIGRDITEQRAIEEALRQSQKMEAVGQLTGGIAHDFNNLLQGITGSLDILHNRLQQGRIEDLDRWITGARSSAERAASLTHRLLAFSRRQPLDPKPLNVNPLVASIEDLLHRTLGENIQLQFVFADDIWMTRCDPNQLESALLNLVINARDAMPEGGRLTIETSNVVVDDPTITRQHEVKPGAYICISITDTGVGMDHETLSRAFEPFFTTKPIGQGTGLGLSMIYGFARQSEGFAQIASEIDQGTTFQLYLPRHDDVPETIEASYPPRLAHTTKQGETILVIEDEPVVRGLIIEVLNDLGYTTIEACDGPSGLSILAQDQEIDLLITDIGLPGLNGRQVVEAARALRPDLKTLYMTGYAENAAMAEGFLDTRMGLITKPFAIDILASKVKDIVNS